MHFTLLNSWSNYAYFWPPQCSVCWDSVMTGRRKKTNGLFFYKEVKFYTCYLFHTTPTSSWTILPTSPFCTSLSHLLVAISFLSQKVLIYLIFLHSGSCLVSCGLPQNLLQFREELVPPRCPRNRVILRISQKKTNPKITIYFCAHGMGTRHQAELSHRTLSAVGWDGF